MENNRLSWDTAIQRHNLIKGNISEVIARGPGYVYDEIYDLLPKTTGKVIVQLFCNDGRELLSLVKKGGVGVGVDFSVNAIQLAYKINEQLNYHCSFVCDDVMTWLQGAKSDTGDIFFTSLGSLWWIPNIHDYFQKVFNATRPGGIYLIWDFHPLIHILDDELSLKYNYPFELITRFHESGIVDYVTDPDSYHFVGRNVEQLPPFDNPYPVHDYLWGMANIIESASLAGWRIARMVEYPYILGEKYLGSLVRQNENRFAADVDKPDIPLTFCLQLMRS